ncbi:hypothetical protein ACTA71_009061 [Dictyostelium dimigraforme]
MANDEKSMMNGGERMRLKNGWWFKTYCIIPITDSIMCKSRPSIINYQLLIGSFINLVKAGVEIKSIFSHSTRNQIRDFNLVDGNKPMEWKEISFFPNYDCVLTTVASESGAGATPMKGNKIT